MEVDLGLARQWYGRVADQGHEDVIAALEELDAYKYQIPYNNVYF